MNLGDKYMNNDEEKELLKYLRRLGDNMSLLTQELCELRQLKQNEFEWFKSYFKFATKDDLKEMEKRLVEAIAKDSDITPSIEKAAMKVQSALDKLDALIPDKKQGKK